MSGSAEASASRVADYRKEKHLGKGSYGTASLCTRLKDERLCVIKTINLSALSARDRGNAAREVRILEKLDHPNVIRYFDSFTEEGVLCIVTEYADGGDLAQYIKSHVSRKERIREDTILSWTVQLVLALKYLHENKILHRDLKPANIFLTRNNVIKLGDFGVSTVLQATMNFAETFCGTPYYLSPEVCEERPYNNKADVWAFGCCVYECMALHRPFEGKNILALADKICKGFYAPLPDCYSQDLRDFVGVLLSRQAVVRPNVHRILKQELMKRALPLLSSDLLEAEKYQRVLHTQNLQNLGGPAKGRGKSGGRRTDALDEKAMQEFVNKDKGRLDNDEFSMLSSGFNTSLASLKSTTSRVCASPAAEISPASPAPRGGLQQDAHLRDEVRQMLARKEAQLAEGADPDPETVDSDVDYRAMQDHITSALEKEEKGGAEDDEDIEDQDCVYADFLRSRMSDLSPTDPPE
eukprot:Hpha_TRINITY_DN13917_c0_g1::TRINITY_DN13917_c0_g1_i1::g.35448::m.35448/K08857/NEK1_4_5; NIMA (never in mitosis gene a)-related kinase 1/4/5